MDLEPVEPADAAIGLRLTKGQIELIWPGLNHVMCGALTREARRAVRTAYPFRIQPLPPGFDSGTFSPQMMNRVGVLQVKLQPLKQTGGKVRLDTFELRAAAYCARTSSAVFRMDLKKARKQGASGRHRADLAEKSLERLQTRKPRLLEFLETHMKRAESQFLKVVPRDEYRALSNEWKSHLRWMEFNLAYFKPFRASPISLRKTRIDWVDQLVRMAEKAITARKLQLPEEERLRGIIRLYLNYSRRGRMGSFHHRYMLDNSESPIAQAKLFEFLEPRLYLERAS